VPGDPRLRVALAGCGRLAERGYAAAFRSADSVELAGVADVHPDRGRAVFPGIPAYPSLEALLEAGRVDAVVVATPTGEHVAGARVATERGLPVLVEKPPASSVADAALLGELDPSPWIGFNRRFDPRVHRLRDGLPAGELELELELRAAAARWRPFVAHEEALIDLGIHLFDLARWLTGSEVDGVHAATLTGRRVEVELRLDGSKARVRCASDRLWAERVIARAANGGRRIRSIRGGVPRLVLSRLGFGRPPDALVITLTRQLEAFASEVRDGVRTALARPADGVAALAIADAARESHRRGGELVSPSR